MLAEHAPDLIGRQFFAQLSRVWQDMADKADATDTIADIPTDTAL